MIHFIIGTRAQLFKMAPIMLECQRRNLKWRWIYTAQHKETIKNTLKTFNLPQPDAKVMEWSTEAKTISKMVYWFTRMFLALFKGEQLLGGHKGKQSIVLTHGDTITTWWGALIGRLYGCKVMHVEAGLRSFNLFRPFPEEINRLITFRLANYYACPGKWACGNLRKYKGKKINTIQNTQIDTLQFGLKNCDKADFEIPKEPYVVASIHRYENIFKKAQFEVVVSLLELVAKNFKIFFILHPATEIQLKKFKLKQRVEKNKKIKIIPRQEYLPFIKSVKHAEFVITDGGGNQEELYHMGKPTLLFRTETERREGLEKTTVISNYKKEIVINFINNYKKYSNQLIKDYKSPSKIIVNFLESFIYESNYK